MIHIHTNEIAVWAEDELAVVAGTVSVNFMPSVPMLVQSNYWSATVAVCNMRIPSFKCPQEAVTMGSNLCEAQQLWHQWL